MKSVYDHKILKEGKCFQKSLFEMIQEEGRSPSYTPHFSKICEGGEVLIDQCREKPYLTQGGKKSRLTDLITNAPVFGASIY